MEPVIQLINVSKSFRGEPLFHDVNLTIHSGEVVGFIGRNGCGKSVLFKLMAGIYRPDSGEIFVRGERLGETADFPENMGLMVDSPGFIDVCTGFQNLQYLASIRGKIDDGTIAAYMELVGLNPRNKTRVKNYSLGMKQKLAIAQAIMENQDILLLDEPFNALDEEIHENMLALITRLKEEGKTILLTSHNSDDIDAVCSRKYQIRNHCVNEMESIF